MLILWIVWAGVAAILLALLAYRGTITRYEEDQSFLDPACATHWQEQVLIQGRIHRIQPFVRFVTAASCVLSVFVICVYVLDLFQQLR